MNSFVDSQVQVQIQDETGMWRTVAVSLNEPQIYAARMREASFNHPDKRIRVIDANGRLLDMG
jgi:hypothetical protein